MKIKGKKKVKREEEGERTTQRLAVRPPLVSEASKDVLEHPNPCSTRTNHPCRYRPAVWQHCSRRRRD